MISSRCPRPIGTIASIALMPVCKGTFTGARSCTPYAMRSIGRICVFANAPLPSTGSPSTLITRPTISSDTGMESTAPVLLTNIPSFTRVVSPKIIAFTISSSRFTTSPSTPLPADIVLSSDAPSLSSNTIRSDIIACVSPSISATPSATFTTVPTRSTDTSEANPSISFLIFSMKILVDIWNKYKYAVLV